MKQETHCAHCGKRMTIGRNGRRRYCTSACRQAAYRARRDGEAVTLAPHRNSDGQKGD